MSVYLWAGLLGLACLLGCVLDTLVSHTSELTEGWTEAGAADDGCAGEDTERHDCWLRGLIDVGE